MMKESRDNSYIEEGMNIAFVPNCHNLNQKVLRDSGAVCITTEIIEIESDTQVK